ncbi:hypothetical protein KP509_34G023900 [Ceratopteris richardii]|nr:hypothetical protein KP509_34G023900 [Ceratopteris richardii]
MMPNKSNLDVKASAELGDNENKRCPPNEIIRFGHDGAYNSVSTERKSSSPSKSNLHLPEQTFLSSSKSKPSQPSPPPLPPPPPPLPYPRPSSLRPSSPPPAPAPPSTDSIRPQSSQTLPLTPPQRPTMKSASITRSSRLRKSPTIGRIHLEMKKKIEGLPSSKSQQTDVAMKHRTTGNNSRDGMAKAVAEITRRSAYFQKIDDDVHKYTESILTVKSRLETFETANMHHLTQFQSEIEAHLEQLSDETQVLARFDRFPIQKLECVRAAASLYLKLTSTTNQIEKWDIESPLSEQFEKVNAFFDKVKTDVEAVERAKEDNNRRFSSHKIYFDFGILTSIKEAAVDLSSRCLSSALAESQTIRSNVKMGEQLCNRDMNKLMAVFQVLYKAFLFAFKVHNFAGGHDDKAEHLSSQLALEMDLYPPSFWSQLAN